MNPLRVGTRGSDLALWQTQWVCQRLGEVHPSIEIERIIIKTQGDADASHPFGGDWPVGAFVSALEKALLEDRIDLAVHSYKDLQTEPTPGLLVAAIPPREVAHDLLLTRARIELAKLPVGFKLGTSSPRRTAQFRRWTPVQIVPLRGNLPTRVAKLVRGEMDGIVLAAAGFKRLSLAHPHVLDLPVERFVPAPAQGALAVQTRSDTAAAGLVAAIDHTPSRRAVEAERSVLRAIHAGCHTPVGALASVDRSGLSLHGQLFSGDYARMAEAAGSGEDPLQVGQALAERLMNELGETT